MLHPIEENINGVQFTLLPVAGGRFLMGSPDNDPEALTFEKPQHEVRLSDFYIARYPVTQALWRAVAQAAPQFELEENPSYFQGDDLPVEQVSWEDITDKFLPALEHLSGKKYRLPTEAEWEYAARGGKYAADGYRYAGGDRLKDLGWYEDNSGDMTRPVGLQQANQLGLYDMSGNVWEWCQDAWDADFYKKCEKEGIVDNPSAAGDRGSDRVIRGGGWLDAAQDCRSAYRGAYWPVARWYYYGFRLALSLQSVGLSIPVIP